jgi:phytanoyl-CoA hydroxylase
MRTLDERKQLVSDLWLDQPDAHDQIDSRLRQGCFSTDEAERLHHFTDRGYMTLSLGLTQDFVRAFEAEVDSLWDQQPVDLAVGKQKARVSLRDFDEGRHHGHRIADLHSHSRTALDLYLNPTIFRMVELIFDQRAIATQSLYFQFGSEQKLHRDPMFVTTKPASHLLASWIALEDVSAACGPLLYVPGSHRMPWYEFADDEIVMRKKDAAQKRQVWNRYRDEQVDRMGLEPAAFTCKRGDVFIWHAGLLHGGKRVQNKGLTRKSFVVHYSTAANYKSRSAAMKVKSAEQGEDVWRLVRGTTSQLRERNECLGLDNPLRHAPLPQDTAANRRPNPPARSREASPEKRAARHLSGRGHPVGGKLRRLSRLVRRSIWESAV